MVLANQRQFHSVCVTFLVIGLYKISGHSRPIKLAFRNLGVVMLEGDLCLFKEPVPPRAKPILILLLH